jgi:integrase
MLRTGLRIQALHDANIEDIDFTQVPYRLFVRHKGKTDKKEWVLLFPGAWKPLNEYLNKRYGNDNALFVSDYHPHSRVNTVTIYRDVADALRLAGIQGKSPHDLRHTAITLARQAGVPLDAVREMAGHADPATTLRYDHSIQRNLGIPEEALERILSTEGENKDARRTIETVVLPSMPEESAQS